MSTEDLSQKKAQEKLKELAEKARVCMFCSELNQIPQNSRPMSLQECDEDGNLWFLSSASSNKNFEIQEDNRVHLYFMNNGDYEYLSIFGKAYIYRDKSTVEQQWSEMANAWFDGKEDPDVSVIRVTPVDTYYWDTKAGKFVSMLSFITAAVTGSKSDGDDGVEGSITIN